MENKNKICPVFEQHPICLPHEVCAVCYEKAKNIFAESEECLNQIIKRRDGLECDLSLTKDWIKENSNGLGAIKVIAESILDYIEDDKDHQWHKHRIRFMQDMVKELDLKYFAPATRQQIDDFAQSAADFWDGKITTQEARERLLFMRKIVQKDIMKSSDWEPKDFLLWMMETEEVFDWMWSQWFECIHACIPDKCNDELWIKMFHKHFHNEIKVWVDK